MGKKSFFGADIQTLGEMSGRGDWESGQGKVEKRPILANYAARLLRDVKPGKKLKVAWDTGNGAVGVSIHTVVDKLEGGDTRSTLQAVVPVTSLCPCSKKISAYGAHNQRSHVTIAARVQSFVWIEELIDLAEKQASSELYGLLKRPDEKYVTELAYDNPKFVEDMVRDIAAKLNEDARIEAYVVESENFESIHNHSAYAMIRKNWPSC